MLNGRLTLHDITDVEAFCTTIANGSLRQHNPTDQEDLIAYLIEETWILSLRYHPGGITFSTWARHTLHRRTIDHLRKRDGRTTWQFNGSRHERARRTIVSLDDPDARRLDSTHTSSPVDAAGDSPPDLTWALSTRAREDPRHHAKVDQPTARHAA